MFVSIIIFIISLAILILIHEMGHFSVAKFFKIRVDEFGLGLPPRALGKKIGETVYSLNWIPFGGFVKIFGEDPEESRETGTQSNFNDALFNKPKFVQAAVLFAGVFFNFVFAWFLISFGYMNGLPAVLSEENSAYLKNHRPTITEILPNSPAEKSGLLPGDAIVSVRNENGELRDDMLTAENISNLTSMSGQAVSIVYIRGSESAKNTFVVPEEGIVNGRKAVGIAVAEVGILKLPFLKSFVEGGISIGRMIADIWRGITQLFSGSGWSQITGPVGLAKVAGKTGQLGFSYFISLIAFVSVNLAVINLLPFPALDGGRLAVLTLEAIIRRPLKPAAVRWINSAGFAILLILMVVITIHDILRI